MNSDTEVMDLPEVTTHNGTIRVGDHFHDKRTSNRRWLRVDTITTDRYGVTVYYTVVHQEHPDGTVTQPEREGDMKANRLLSSVFIRTTGPGIAADR